jgi:hypothetical protein
MRGVDSLVEVARRNRYEMAHGLRGASTKVSTVGWKVL